MPRSCAALSLALLLSACGPGKGGSTDSNTDGSESGDPSTGTSTTSTTDTSTSVPTTAGVTEDTAASCEQFLNDDPIGPAAMITIRHQGSEPVWVPASSCAGLPTLRILDSELDDYFSPGSNCFPVQCEEFMQLDDCQRACDDCAAPSLVRIDPGAAITINWPGARLVELEMTAACAPGVGCQRACLRGEQAATGVYTIELPAFRVCEGACACEGASGWCPIFEPVELAEETTFAAALSYPDVTAIDVVIDGP